MRRVAGTPRPAPPAVRRDRPPAPGRGGDDPGHRHLRPLHRGGIRQRRRRAPHPLVHRRPHPARPRLSGGQLAQMLSSAKPAHRPPRCYPVLEVPAVHRCFELDAEAVERIRGWVRDSGIRWGADAAHRARACHGLGDPQLALWPEPPAARLRDGRRHTAVS
ncbi:MAG: hypothetical protein U5L11_14135 [Arhodomonas sp.]|nr:hypothetical protein [Arhodomonas sp.]